MQGKESEIELLSDRLHILGPKDQLESTKNTPNRQNSPTLQPPKRILLGQSILSALLFGVYSFLQGFLSAFNLTTTFLNFSGFLLVSIVFKLLNAKGEDRYTSQCQNGLGKRVYYQFFGKYYDLDTRHFNLCYFVNIVVRCINQIISFLMGIKSIQYAYMAQVNFGIITSCYATSIIVNTLAGIVMFRERLSFKLMLGGLLIITGIIWISIDKGRQKMLQNHNESQHSDDDREYYKVISLTLAVMVGVANALQTVHSKLALKYWSFTPMRMASDALFMMSIIGMSVTAINYFIFENPDVNLRNLFISFASSTSIGVCAIVSMNALTKGLAGPTSAIVYTQNFYCTALDIVFKGLVPTIPQFLSSLIAFGGILIIMLFK